MKVAYDGQFRRGGWKFSASGRIFVEPFIEECYQEYEREAKGMETHFLCELKNSRHFYECFVLP